MVRTLAFLVVASSYACAAQQQLASRVPPVEQTAQQTIFRSGPDLVAPELIPPRISLEKIHHCQKLDGKVVVSVIVDAQGSVHAPGVTRSAGSKLNEVALALVEMDHFKPGTHAGSPATVEMQIELDLKTCSLDSERGNAASILASLREQPIQRVTPMPPVSPEIAELSETQGFDPAGRPNSDVKHEVTPPVPLNSVTARYTPAARKAKIEGACLVQLTVDADGNPENPTIVKSLDPSLDQAAIKAAMQYRFKPAAKGGQPIAVRITIQVNFKLR